MAEDRNPPPKRAKRAAMNYKSYLQPDSSQQVPRTTLLRHTETTSNSQFQDESNSLPVEPCSANSSSFPAQGSASRCSPTLENFTAQDEDEILQNSQIDGSGAETNNDQDHEMRLEQAGDTDQGHGSVSETGDRDQDGSGSETGDTDQDGSGSETGDTDHDNLSHSSDTESSSSENNYEKPIGLEDADFLRTKYGLDKEVPIDNSKGLTKIECLILMLSFSMRHGLSDVGLKYLLEMCNFLLGTEIIPSLYIFHKIFHFEYGVEYHFYCSACEAYIGSYSNLKEKNYVECPTDECKVECNVKNMNNGHFFMVMPLEPQLQCFLESKSDMLEMLSYRVTREHNDDTISDIFDGSLYKKLAKDREILSDPKNFSITINTDGSPIFVSSNCSMWPIFCRMNELPPDKRFNSENMFVTMLWFGSNHPNMNVIFSQFLLESRRLHQNGLKWSQPNGELVLSKVVTLNACLDSVAKPICQCRKTFHAYDGCGYCYHCGTLVDLTNDKIVGRDEQPDSSAGNRNEPPVEARGKVVKQVRYTHSQGERFPDRKDAEVRSDMIESHNSNKVVRGYKGISPFIVCLSFNLVFGFVIDYMHGVLLGVTKQLVTLWLERKYCKRDFYLRQKLSEINERLLKFKPPVGMSRRPRSLAKYVRWKANELRSWLFYYCLPCLFEILPRVYYDHLVLLVTSIYILCSDCITKDDLDAAELYLNKFVDDFETLYGPSQMVFNVHLLTHLITCVKMWGPLWAYSAFCFENSNGVLKQMVKGTCGVVSQISRKYSMYRFLPEVLATYDISDKVSKRCNNLLFPKKRSQNVSKVSRFTLMDESLCPLSDEKKQAIASANIAVSNCTFYDRMISQGMVFHSRTYTRQGKKSFDGAVCLENSKFAIIEGFFLVQDNVYLICKKINIELNSNLFKHNQCNANAPHIKVCDLYPYGDLYVTSAASIIAKCILVKTSFRTFLTVLPNRYEKD